MSPHAIHSTSKSDVRSGNDDSSSSKQGVEELHHHLPQRKVKVSGIQWLALKLKLVEKDATPPNWKYITLVFAALFSSCNTLTYLFPFLPEMILFLGYDETEKGTYAGIIASGVFAGRAFGSLFWGWLADRKGRKIVLLITIVLNGLFCGLFGLAVNIYLGFIFRFLCGLVNGTVGTAKAILYDISDDTNQALSMTILSLAWGSGLIVGPLMGGLLASPATKWPAVFDEHGLFGQFPFLLASIFPCIICFLVFFLILFRFDETLINNCKRQKLNIDPETVKGDKPDSSAVEKSKLPLLRPNSDKGFHHSTPHLAGSIISLSPEAEMSICLGKEAIKRQHSLDALDIHGLTKSEPDLMMKFSGNYNSPQFENLELGVLSHSVGHMQQSSAVVQKPTNGIVNGHLQIGDAQHSTLLPSKDNQSSTAKHRHLCQRSVSYDPKLPSDSVSELYDNKDKLNMVLEISDQYSSLEKEDDICRCADWCCKLSCCWICTNSSLHKLLRISDVWTTTLLYTCMSFVTIAIDDVFPVFASTAKDYGGLGFTTSEIGLALGAMTLPLLVLQLKLYPFVAKRFGIRLTFIIFSVICLVCAQLIPLIRLLNSSPALLWVTMMMVQVPLKIGINSCFASTALLINNSITPELAGQANGLAMTVTAIGRSMAPVIGGSLFSWCVTYGPTVGLPFDTSFPFFVIGFMYFVSCVECLFIKPSLDKQKK